MRSLSPWALCVSLLVACAAKDADDGAASPTEQPSTTTAPDAGPAPTPTDESACPAPEAPVTGAFSKIYDPGVGESRAHYINDHTFVRAKDGTWHLFGITHEEPANPLDEKTFAHATAPSLKGPWTKKPPALVVDTSRGESLLWAPFVLAEGDTYYMFYCGGGPDHTQYRISLATSKDLETWTRDPAPLFIDGYDARDPYVMKVGSQWVLYYTATSQPSGGHHVVFYRTSTDLRHWSASKTAFEDPTIGDIAGPTESPFVVARGGDYYLFIGPREDYADTAVFHSKDPFHFDPNDQVHRFPSHAAEVVEDTDGSLWASHAGWGQGGVHLAPLSFAPARCRTLEGDGLRAVVETSPRAGLVALSSHGEDLLSTTFRKTGPYLGIGKFASHVAGAAAKVVYGETSVTLSGITFQDQPITADWTLCRDQDLLDQRLTWHVHGATTAPVWEVSFGVSSRLGRVGDDRETNANGDFPGLGSYATFSGPSSTLAFAYAPRSAWREDNRWLSSKRGTAAWQPLWARGGTSLAPGIYDGGLYRLGASRAPDDRMRAQSLANGVAAAKKNACAHMDP